MRNVFPSPLMWTVEALAVAKKGENKYSSQWNQTFLYEWKIHFFWTEIQIYKKVQTCKKQTSAQDNGSIIRTLSILGWGYVR